jgi:hypothetical protein
MKGWVASVLQPPQLHSKARSMKTIDSPFLNRSIQISAWAKFHDLTPVLGLVLYEVDSLDDVWVVQCGRDAKFRGELLDVFFLGLILTTFPKFLCTSISIDRECANRTAVMSLDIAGREITNSP